MKKYNFASILIPIAFAVIQSCGEPKQTGSKSDADNKNETTSTPTTDIKYSNESANRDTVKPEQKTDSSLLLLNTEILVLIKNKEYNKLAKYFHPLLGVRFSPYAYVDTTKNLRFTSAKFLALVNKGNKIKWGEYDGSGDPILLSVHEYFAKFVYDCDFVKPEIMALDDNIGTGNTYSNLNEIYLNCHFVENHFSGFEEKYEGMDWRSLRLVFKEHNDKYYLVAIIHDQWTV